MDRIITTLQKISLPQIITPAYKSEVMNMSVFKTTYMTVKMTVIKKAGTTVEPITKTTIISITLLTLTKIMTTIWERMIK